MEKKASRHEESAYQLTGKGWYVDGDWTSYDVTLNGSNATGRTVVGIVSKRSGGGWICTLPVFAMEDNGIAGVRRRVGYVKGRGATPQDALAEADRLSLMGPEAIERYEQEALT